MTKLNKKIDSTNYSEDELVKNFDLANYSFDELIKFNERLTNLINHLPKNPTEKELEGAVSLLELKSDTQDRILCIIAKALKKLRSDYSFLIEKTKEFSIYASKSHS